MYVATLNNKVLPFLGKISLFSLIDVIKFTCLSYSMYDQSMSRTQTVLRTAGGDQLIAGRTYKPYCT